MTAPWLSVSSKEGHWVAEGTRFQADPEGGGWSHDDGVVTVTTDGLGFRPRYYTATSDRLIVSDDLVELVEMAKPTELNHEALDVFAYLGFLIGDDTPFRGIYRVPRTGLKWSRGVMTVGSQPEPVAPSSGPRTRLLDTYIGLFEEAVAKIADVPALGLSGGRDSRHMLLELVHQQRAPRRVVTVIRRDRRDPDVRVAGILARRLDIPHIVVPPQKMTIEAERRKNTLTNLNADEHRWLLPMRDVYGPDDPIGDGIGGDVLSGGWFLDEHRQQLLEAGNLRELARIITDYRRAARLAGASRDGRQVVEDRILAELEKYADAPNPLGEFYLWNRTRNELAQVSYAMYRHVKTVSRPFLYPPLAQFLRSIPSAYVVDHRFHTDAIHRAYPHMGDVPFAPDVPKLPVRRVLMRHELQARVFAAKLATSHPLLAAAVMRYGLRFERPLMRALWHQQVRELIVNP